MRIDLDILGRNSVFAVGNPKAWSSWLQFDGLQLLVPVQEASLFL